MVHQSSVTKSYRMVSIRMGMVSDYTKAVRSIDLCGWSADSISVNIPGHPEDRYASPSGRYEVEISPMNGYDDGQLHEDRLHFFVNVYTYRVADNGDRIEEEGQVFSRRVDTAEAAAELAQQKLNEYAQKSDA